MIIPILRPKDLEKFKRRQDFIEHSIRYVRISGNMPNPRLYESDKHLFGYRR